MEHGRGTVHAESSSSFTQLFPNPSGVSFPVLYSSFEYSQRIAGLNKIAYFCLLLPTWLSRGKMYKIFTSFDEIIPADVTY
jgi:hypothetical protein